MFIEAIHIDTREQCYVNTDFIVDIFKKRVPQNYLHNEDYGTNTQYIAYTFDNERGGYAISKLDFEKVLSEPINCVKCEHYYETEDDNGVVGHCKIDTAHIKKQP